MATTPEGKIKDELKALLATKGEQLHALWPVQNGMGTPALDVHICYKGRYLAIETKAPGKHMTPRQVVTATKLHKAGAKTILIDGSDAHWQELLDWFNRIDDIPHVVMDLDTAVGCPPATTEEAASGKFMMSADRKKLPDVCTGDKVRINIKGSKDAYIAEVMATRTAAVALKIITVL